MSRDSQKSFADFFIPKDDKIVYSFFFGKFKIILYINFPEAVFYDVYNY